MIEWEIPLPSWLRAVEYQYVFVASLGFGMATVALFLIAYKIKKTTPPGHFQRRLYWFFLTSALYCGINMLLWHPFYNHVPQLMAAIPHLASLIELCRYTIKHYGIGGDPVA